MKAVIFLMLTLISMSAFSAPWKGAMFCGSYTASDYGDTSKYVVGIDEARDSTGIERKLFLYKNHSDGSRLIDEAYGCEKKLNILRCSVGDVTVELDTTQKTANNYFIYEMKITVPSLIFASKTYAGKCSRATDPF